MKTVWSGEGQNFEQLNFRMADISILKINECANLERLNLRVIKIENEIHIKGQYENRRNCEWCGISNGRKIPKFANFWNSDNFPN